MKKIFLSFIIYPLLFHHLQAQHNFDTFNKLLDSYEKNDSFNGVILIAEKGNIIFSRTIGYADFDKKIELDLNTPMHLASNTKAFTNMGIMILQERGLLNYDDKVNKYIQEFPYGDITLRHLMSMTSGLKRLYNKDLNKDGFITNTELLKFLATKKPKLTFTPGDQVQSSVVGYCILAEVIASISKKDYKDFIYEEIFKPLQMGKTFFVHKNNLDRFRAISYNKKNMVEEWYLGSYIGGISIYASANDVLKWDQALYSNQLVSKKTMNLALENFQFNNGDDSHLTLGGWMKWKGKANLIFKNGDRQANNSILWRDIAQNRTIIILNNRQNKISKFDLMDSILPLLGYNFDKS